MPGCSWAKGKTDEDAGGGAALPSTRLTVKPGITGLAQIRGRYDLKPDRKVKYDILYVQNRSIRLNMVLLLLTIPVVFRRQGR